MGIFKEEVRFLEDLERRQTRVWPDSADLGINASEIDMPRMKEVLTTLLSLDESKVAWKANEPAIQRQYELVVLWGLADERTFDATKCRVLYYKGRGKEFFSIKTGHAFIKRERR